MVWAEQAVASSDGLQRAGNPRAGFERNCRPQQVFSGNGLVLRRSLLLQQTVVPPTTMRDLSRVEDGPVVCVSEGFDHEGFRRLGFALYLVSLSTSCRSSRPMSQHLASGKHTCCSEVQRDEAPWRRRLVRRHAQPQMGGFRGQNNGEWDKLCFDHKGGSSFSRHIHMRFLVHTVFFQRLAPGVFWGGTWMQMVCIGCSRVCPCCLPF